MLLSKRKNHKIFLIVVFVITVFLFVPTGVNICFSNELNQSLFLKKIFKGIVPKPDYLWITPTVRPIIEEILLSKYKGLRIKYWKKNDRVVWILEETAKDTKVCAGIVVSQEKIHLLEILFAEGRYGSLVKNKKFTGQFKNIGAGENNRLARSIDGISGATLSVNTVSRLAQMALVLDGLQRMEAN